ncbi:MAG TPA: response regulator [Vicinamibacterales bacterium]|nr:response regulator [Vicinamibacterales bacterium]
MPRKLLLADDSVTIQRVIELTFVDEDIHVIAVGDGRAAVERIEREPPDIVLADIGMPERDGYEVAAFVKGHPSLQHIPVILLTGAFEPIDEARAKSVGCDGVLVKPFEPQMVINRVKDLLTGRRSAQPQPAAPGPAPVPLAPQADVRPMPPQGGDSLDAYFDRLDAAFAAVGAPAPDTDTPPHGDPLMAPPAPTPPPAASAPVPAPPRTPLRVSDLGSWDPDLPGDPASPAPMAVPPPPVSVAPVEPAPAQPEETPVPAAAPLASAAPPSLAEAFAALLSAEQRLPVAPSTATVAVADAALIDAVVTRVLARLGESSLRPAILDAAERLVREEIAHIKASGS